MPQPVLANLQPFVDRLASHSTLSENEQRAILTLPFRPVEVPAKREFSYLNDEATCCCLISSGLVARFQNVSRGLRQITAFHIPGEVTGISTLVQPRQAGGLTAIPDTIVLRINHSSLRGVAAQYPAILEALWRDCVQDEPIIRQWTSNVGRRNAKARLAHLLCEMAIRYGSDGRPLLNFPFPITQEQLADATALTPVHVNRSLKLLREAGLVTIGSGRACILQWKGLVDVGDFDGAYLSAADPGKPQRRMLAN